MWGRGALTSRLTGFNLLKAYTRGQIAILASWFGLLVGIRLLLSFVLSNFWVGTIGATALTFVVFYLVIRYTSLSKHANLVNKVIQDWYSKKYMMYALISSMTVLSMLVFMAEYGYAYHPGSIFTLKDVEIMQSIDSARGQIIYSMKGLLNQGYSGFDIISILVASVDKSMGGHYIQMIGFILAEDIEILVFMIVLRRVGQQIFPTQHSDKL